MIRKPVSPVRTLRLAAGLVLLCALPAQAAFDVTVVATGAGSGGSWVGNIWRATADKATVPASEIEAHLVNGDVIVNNWSSGGAQNGDLTVSGAVSWSANTLMLSAARHITVDAALTGAVGGTARLVLEYGQATLAANNAGVYRINTPVTLRSDPVDPRGVGTFSLKQGVDGATVARPVPGCPVWSNRGGGQDPDTGDWIGGYVYDCKFLSTAAEPNLDIKYRTVEINGITDTDIWVYVNQQSLFSGVYYPYVMTYQGSRGSVRFPNSEEQELHFDANGVITSLPELNALTTTYKSARTWDMGPVYQLFSSSVFDHGYYLKFTPNAGESGNAYQIVSLLTVPLFDANTSYEVVDYVINVQPDTAPDPFAFNDLTGVALSTRFQSNPITVSGITNTTAISVAGGEYRINGGAWTSSAGTVSLNNTVEARHTSSASHLAMTDTVLTIGGVADTFSTTTAAAVAPAITSGAPPDGVVGAAYGFTVTADFGGVVFGAPDGLPFGLAINPTTGAISGTPTTAGTFPTTITVYDPAEGVTTAADYTIVVVEPTHTLTVTSTGNGVGSVGGGGVYAHGAVVTPTATANPGSHFAGWSGGCSGSFTITGDITCAANFTLDAYAITTSAGAGGTASCAPNPVNHGDGGICTATADPGYSFIGWSGDCAGMTCVLDNVTGSRSVEATFAAIASVSGPSATGSGTITAGASGGGASCRFVGHQFLPLAVVPVPPPAGASFPHGLFEFTLDGCVAGGAVTLTVTYPQAPPAGTQYWKYGPTPDDAAPHWYVMPATIAGNTATFSITDGGLGDDDLTANGVIVDQGGPGVGSAKAIPTLNEWGLLLLSLAVGGLAAAMGTGRSPWRR